MKPEILAGTEFGCWTQIVIFNSIGRSKFGGSVRDHHMCELEILPDFNLAAAKTNCHFFKFPAGPKNTTIVYV